MSSPPAAAGPPRTAGTVDADDRGRGGWLGGARARAVVLVAAAGSAGSAALLRERLFPAGGPNNDEAVYLLQAKAWAAGRLLPAATDAAHRVWFFVPGPHGAVGKYEPVAAAWFAVSLLLAHSVVPALAVAAGVAPLMAAVLTRALGGSGRAAATAAVLLAASPLLLLQSAQVLSYVVTLDLELVAVAAAVRYSDGRRPGRGTAAGTSPHRGGVVLAVAGCAAALATVSRPVDGLAVCAPVLLWLLGRELAVSWRRALRALGCAAAGTVPVAVAAGAYNARAEGSPLRLPFSLLEPADRYGFGGRRLVPEDGLHFFGPVQAVQGWVAHLGWGLLGWTTAGPLLLAIAARAAAPTVRRALAGRPALRAERPPTAEERASGAAAGAGGGAVPARGAGRWWHRPARWSARTAVTTAAVLLGGAYVPFWGPWLASLRWGGPRALGPFYALPLAALLIVLTAPAVAGAWHRQPRPAPGRPAGGRPVSGRPAARRAATVLAVLLPFAVLADALDLSAVNERRTHRVLATAARVPAGIPLLLDGDPPYLAHPVSALSSLGPGRVAAVALASQLPPVPSTGSAGYLLHLPGDPYRRVGGLAIGLDEEGWLRGPTLRVRLRLTGRLPAGTALLVQRGPSPQLCPLPVGGVVVTLPAAGGVQGCSGLPVAPSVLADPRRHCTSDSCLTVAAVVPRRHGARTVGPWRVLPIGTEAGSVVTRVDVVAVLADLGGWWTVSAA